MWRWGVGRFSAWQFRTTCFLKHLLQVGFVFSRCALAAIHGVDQIKVLFSVQTAFDFQIIKLLLQVPVITAQKAIVELHDRADWEAETTASSIIFCEVLKPTKICKSTDSIG